MKLFVEYFGLLVFWFVVAIGALVALPAVTETPPITTGETVGLGFAFLALAGGFMWYYFVSSIAETADPDQTRRDPRDPSRGGRGA